MKFSNKKGVKVGIVSIIILLIVASLSVALFNKEQGIAWGSDTYRHLYKSRLLYEAMTDGQIFLNYDWNWYNGIQPFRYWAPLTYYIIAGLNFLVRDIEIAYNLFMMFIFVIGGSGFVVWGNYLKRPMLGLVLGLLWFFVPNNMRVFFAEGDLPATLVISFLPYIFLFFYRSMKEKRRRYFIGLTMLMAMTTLSHIMLTVLVGFTLVVYGMILVFSHKAYKEVFRALLYAGLGVLLVGFWFVPALKGNVLNIPAYATEEAAKRAFFPLSQSLNPFLRLNEPSVYYFGLSFAIIIILGCLFAYKKYKSAYIVAGLMGLGTTTVVWPVLKGIPFGEFLWMKNGTSLAICLIFIGILTWKSLRKSLLGILILIMAMDSSISCISLGFKVPPNRELVEMMNKAVEIAQQRIALLDLSTNDSYPSYYLAYHKPEKRIGQVFGWAWQGVETVENIVLLNTALEENYYGILLDRALELGADTLIIPEQLINEPQELDKWAEEIGYKLVSSSNTYRIYKYPIEGMFGTKVNYEGLLIGEKASNLEYIFPTFIKGKTAYIDDYTIEELLQYKAIYLAEFKYHSKEMAQKLLTEVAQRGVKVVMDTTGETTSLFGLNLQPISIKEKFNQVYYKGKLAELSPFPEALSDFRTSFIAQEVEGAEENYAVIEHKRLNYLYEHETNLYSLALNLPYYAYITQDKEAISILQDLLGVSAYTLPNRKVVPLQISQVSDEEIVVKAEEEGVIAPIAYLDVFEAKKGDFVVQNQLLKLTGKSVHLNIVIPYNPIGWGTSLIALISLIGITTVHKTKRKEEESIGV